MTEAEQKTAKKRAKRYQSINLSCIKILIKFIKYDIKNSLKQKMNKKKKNPNVDQKINNMYLVKVHGGTTSEEII